MINIAKRIDTIRNLLKDESDQSITYAALECRLTIEAICYERLALSHEHISRESIKRWQPHHVIKQVTEEANESADKEFTISISRTPITAGNEPESVEEYESFDYQLLGTQAPLDVKKLGRLWNALSNTSLHIDLPGNKNEQVEFYGRACKAKMKIEQALIEFEKLKKGSLLSSGFGEDYFFDCLSCETQIRRKAKLIKNGQIIECLNPDCNETYGISIEDGEVFHFRRMVGTTCASCEHQIDIPTRFVEKLSLGQQLNIKCPECCIENQIRLFPGRVNIVQNDESDKELHNNQINEGQG